MQQSKWTDAFLQEACNILAATEGGLPGSTIVKYMVPKSVVYDIDIPHSIYPFPEGAVPNKRTALYNNIKAFKESEQYEIIKELCDHDKLKDNQQVQDLKSLLSARYSHLSKPQSPKIEIKNVSPDKHLLANFPAARKPYSSGLTKYTQSIYERNALDDMRLSLELFLKQLLSNNKPLEKQISDVGVFAKSKGISTEAVNMFQKLLDYYATYQNTYVKHDDNVNIGEMEFILNLTTSFLGLLIT